MVGTILTIVIVVLTDFILGFLAGLLIKGKSDTNNVLTIAYDILTILFYGVFIYISFKFFIPFEFVNDLIALLLGSFFFLIGVIITIFILGVAFGNLIESKLLKARKK